MSAGPQALEISAALQSGGMDERYALLMGGMLQFLTELHQANPPAAQDGDPARVASTKLHLVEGSLRYLAAWLNQGPAPEEL